MPITAQQTVTVAQYFEPEALVDSVTEITVNPNAEVILGTPTGQNDNRMGQSSFARWMLATNLIGGDLTATPSASSIVIDNGTIGTAQLDVTTPGGDAGLLSGADKTKLDNLSGTDLTAALTTATATVESSTGTDAVIPLANAIAANAGLVTAIEKVKLEDTVYVTDYGADPTGAADSATEVQAAIDDAVSRNIYRVSFPKGTYRIESQINLPRGTSKAHNRFTLDLAGSRIRTSTDITIFARTISASSETETDEYVPIIMDGSFLQDTPGTVGLGRAIEIHAASGVYLRNLKFSGFQTALTCAWCQWGTAVNLNAVNCERSYQIMGSDGLFTPTNLNSNHFTMIGCRSQSTVGTAVNYYLSNSTNIVLLNCVAEGSNSDICYHINGDQGSGRLDGRDATLLNCRCEVKGGTTLNHVVRLTSLQKTTITIDNMQFSSLNAGRLFCSVDNQTKQNIITWKNCRGFIDNTATVPWFDAFILAGLGNQNEWRFENNLIRNGESFQDTAKWLLGGNGDVPAQVFEDSYDYTLDTRVHSDLTVPPSSLLVNADPSTPAFVKPIDSTSLPPDTPLGATLLGWNAGGELRNFDADSVASRVTIVQNTVPTAPQPAGIIIVTQGSDKGVYASNGQEITSMGIFTVEGDWPA